MRAAVFLSICLSFILTLTASDVAAQPAEVPHQDLTRFIDDAGAVRPIETPAHWAQRRRAIRRGFELAAGPMPSRDSLPDIDLQITEDIPFEGVRRLTGTIQVEKTDRLPLDIYLPVTLADIDAESMLTQDTDAKAVPGILALHPTGTAGKRIVAGERPNRQYAVELAQRGCVVVAPDYMSFGEYAYDFEADNYVSGTMKGIFNHMRCVDLLTKIRAVDADRLGVIGHSLGGHNAIFVGFYDERLKVIVSSCGWTPFHHYYEGNLAGWTSLRYMPLIRERYDLNPDEVPFDFYELIAGLAPRTFVSVSPISDSNFDVAGVRKAIPSARRIYRLLNAEQEISLFTPECEHDFPEAMRLTSYRIMERVFGFSPRQPAKD